MLKDHFVGFLILGGGVLKILGCNGIIHAVSTEKVFYDEKGAVAFAKHVETHEIGMCDSTCIGRERVGGFLFAGV